MVLAVRSVRELALPLALVDAVVGDNHVLEGLADPLERIVLRGGVGPRGDNDLLAIDRQDQVVVS
jgi:hypothetical protein